jgi:hypothetical protein
MGYRSAVGICFKRESDKAPTIPELITFAKMKDVLPANYFEEKWSARDYGWDDNKFVFHVEDVKWYESYPEVKAMEQFFEFVGEMNQEGEGEGDVRDWYSGSFARIGEETTDIEEKSFGPDPWEQLCVVRSLELDTSLLGKRSSEVHVGHEEGSK